MLSTIKAQVMQLQMLDNSAAGIVSFLWTVLQYGGMVLAAVGVITFVLARKNSNDELATNAGWIVLGGVAAAAIGAFMGAQALPSL